MLSKTPRRVSQNVNSNYVSNHRPVGAIVLNLSYPPIDQIVAAGHAVSWLQRAYGEQGWCEASYACTFVGDAK